MAKKIVIGMNIASINHAISQLEEYADSLDNKVKRLINELLQIGVTNIEQTISEIPGEEKGEDIVVEKTDAEGSEGHYTAKIVLSGEKVLFIEFSAGVTYGTSEYPLDVQGYGVGTYPGQTHAFDPEGWDYYDETGMHHSYGNRAYMPMYYGDMAIQQQVYDIAKRIFGGD